MLNVPTKFTAPAALAPTKLTGKVVSGDPPPPFTFCAVTGTTTHKLIKATISPTETSFLLILYPPHGSILVPTIKSWGLPAYRPCPEKDREASVTISVGQIGRTKCFSARRTARAVVTQM